MAENPNNIGEIHAGCAEARRKTFQEQHTMDDIDIGDWVKKGFMGECGKLEHMWVKVQSKSGTTIVGILDNDPTLQMHIKFGDVVTLDFAEVESICGEDD